ncbi:transporter substrate-binding domain-containing protein [Corynebacterium anserum]|uniref:Transporter substrate-binding domain-containing protein n=1 Tax=Corynebacterium anserum TaxID=2684406 RepID=A0A7G7YLY8_9CORY|nr:transporter substrate-binding domain-containing protein [Corynebacterium anserum]QNH95508.1 transporter substrate-binding domain-containing protein [Corynebacterium anserum]
MFLESTFGSPRRILARHRAKTIGACLLVIGLTSGCATDTSTNSQADWPTMSPSELESDLPVGAEIVNPKSVVDANPATPSTAQQPWPTIRPDNRTADQRIPKIRKRGRLIVGVGQYLNRLGFRDPLSGELSGFEVDLAREIARDIFGDPKKVEFRYVENRRREAALRNGDVDMVIRTWTVRRDRQYQTEFSLPYLAITPQLLVMRGSEITGFQDLSNSTVCATRDSAPAQSITQYHIGSLMLTRTWTDCLMAMQRSQVDAIFSDDAILSGLQAQDPHTELVGGSGELSYYAVGMTTPTKNNEAEGLVMQVNDTIRRIRSDGTWNRLYNEWMQEYLGAPENLPAEYRTDAEQAEIDKERKEYAKTQHLTSAAKRAGEVPREAFDDR